MKKIFIGICFFSSLFALGLPVEYDPFQKASKIIKEAKSKNKRVIPRRFSFKLQAILNDKAFINGRIVPLGSRIRGYKLVHIGDTFVVLQKGREKKVLVFDKKNILKAEH